MCPLLEGTQGELGALPKTLGEAPTDPAGSRQPWRLSEGPGIGVAVGALAARSAVRRSVCAWHSSDRLPLGPCATGIEVLERRRSNRRVSALFPEVGESVEPALSRVAVFGRSLRMAIVCA
jgi:hypothetical protein